MNCVRNLVFCFVLVTSINEGHSQIQLWYFQDYKSYFRADSCSQNAVISIWGSQYLRIKITDSCKYVEVSCYSSKDSSLKEKGLYYNTNFLKQFNTQRRQAGTDTSFVAKRKRIILKRTGAWNFYNKAGKIVKTIKYR